MPGASKTWRLTGRPRLLASAGAWARFLHLGGHVSLLPLRDVADRFLTPETASAHLWESYLLTALSGREGRHHHAPRPALGSGPGDVIVTRGALLLDQRAKGSWTKSRSKVDSASCVVGPLLIVMWYPFPPFGRGRGPRHYKGGPGTAVEGGRSIPPGSRSVFFYLKPSLNSCTVNLTKQCNPIQSRSRSLPLQEGPNLGKLCVFSLPCSSPRRRS